MFPVGTSVDVRSVPAATIALLFVNAAVAALMLGMSGPERDAFVQAYALVPADLIAHWQDPARLLTLVTNAFLHGGAAHLAINLWTLWIFGPALEERWGPGRFVAFYLACGAIASLTHAAFNGNSTLPALGASGAIAGLLAGFGRVYPFASVRMVVRLGMFPIYLPLPALLFVLFWIALQVAAALLPQDAPPLIAWWAHIGGFAGGAVLSVFLGSRRAEGRSIGAVRAMPLRVGPARSSVITQVRRAAVPALAAPAPEAPAAASRRSNAERALPLTGAVDSGVTADDVAAARLRWSREVGDRYVGPWGATSSRG